MIIYKATNIVNGKSYIGQTKQTLRSRRWQHKSEAKNRSNYVFHKAIRKYGFENFSWEVLCETSSREELDNMEVHYINEQKTLVPHGYNLTSGGNSQFEISEQSRKKMSDAKQGIYDGEKNPMYGKKRTEEEKNIISENRKGKACGKDNGTSIGAGTYKVTHPDGTIEIVKNMRQFCRERGLNHGPFYRLCDGKRTTPYKGYYCERLEHSHQKQKMMEKENGN